MVVHGRRAAERRSVRQPSEAFLLHDLSLVAATFSPLFLGLIFHGVCIRIGWLRQLAIPIDRGTRLRGRPLFGPNKTYRGVIAVGLGAAAGYSLQGLFPQLQAPGLRSIPLSLLPLFGFLLGVAGMLSELPNSLFKRQLGVVSGGSGSGWLAPALYVLDQVDFLLGAWLVVWPWVSPSWSRVLWSVGFVLVVHQTISVLGAALGMRASAR
jgi:hypothetical protein